MNALRPRGLGRAALIVCALLVILLLLALSLEPSRWRLFIVGRKVAGGVPELTWAQLLRMIGPRSNYYLKPVISEGRSIEAAIENPFDSPADLGPGRDLYRTRCAICHVHEGGGRAPLLSQPNFSHGNSDWAIYRIVAEGIAGSAMPASGLSEKQIWQVIAYVRTLQQDTGRAASADAANPPRIEVSQADLRDPRAHGDEWLTYSGAYDGWRYSPLGEVTPANVNKLRLLWVRQLQTTDTSFEATSLVTAGTIFLPEPPSGVVALEASTGRVLWRTTRTLPPKLTLCCGRVNRGMALLGNRLYVGTLDAHLIALDAASGRVVWDVSIADPAQGYSITGAPLIVGDTVVTGVAGGEFGVRGFLAARDAATGAERWRFNTVPGPGEPGHETWKDDSWKQGGAPTWVTGAYDPELGLIYWGVGNPSPVYSGDGRSGDNLYSNSVVALNARTGKLSWYFQFTPHDERDWDSNQTPILADLTLEGHPRKVICWANRNGFYYLLDRVTGQFLLGTPFVKQTWARGLDSHGRPIEAPGSRPTAEGAIITPGLAGGTNWQSAAFDSGNGLLFVPATEGDSIFTQSKPTLHEPGAIFVASGSAGGTVIPVIRALDAATGQTRWSYTPPRAHSVGGRSGLLATKGGLVFGSSEGHLFALDAKSGGELWRIDLGGYSAAPPITFTIDGHQVVLAAAGRAVFLFGL